MALYPDYCTLAELKAYRRISDTVDDAELPGAISSASRAVDRATNRQFGQVSTAEIRYYSWEQTYIEGRAALPIFDVYTTTDLAVAIDTAGDGTYAGPVVVTTDFDLYPWNAALDGIPWTHVVLQPDAAYRFPCRARGVRVTARTGWAAVPAVVKEATKEQANRFAARRESPYGIAGSPDLGNELRLLSKMDPDVELMLKAVRRVWAAA